MKSIIFVEEPVEIKSVIDSGFNIQELIIIALSFRVQSYLKKNNILFCTTLPYFNNDNHRRCLKHSSKIVELIEKEFHYSNKSQNYFGVIDWLANGVRHAATNYIIFLIEVIDKAIRTHKPDQVLISYLQGSNYDGWLMAKNEYYHNQLSLAIAQKYQLEIISFNNIAPIKKDKYSKTHKPVNNTFVSKFNINLKKDSKVVFVTSLGKNLDSLVKNIKRRYPELKVYAYNDDKKGRIKSILYKLIYGIILLDFGRVKSGYNQIDIKTINELLNKALKYSGFNYFELVKPKLEKGIYPSVQRLIIESYCLDQWMQKMKPRLTLSAHSRGITYIVGEICKLKGFNGLCISHGTVVPPKNDMEIIVNRNIAKAVILNDYPSVAIQTPWANEFFIHYNSKSEKIITGQLILSNVTKVKNRKIKILHASTFKNKSNLKFWGVETPDEYLSSLKDLCNMMKTEVNTKLVIKLHKSFFYEADINQIKQLISPPKNVKFSCKDISKELFDTDLLISYSSTVIEEALINRIPVLLYDKWKRYCHYPCINLDKNDFAADTLYYTTSSTTIKRYYKKIIDNSQKKAVNWSKYQLNKGVEHFNAYLDRALS